MDYKFEASARQDTGRNAMRALRKSGMVPAVIYGLDKPKSITCSARSLTNLMQDEAVFSKVITISLEGKTRQAILRDVQRHPLRREILHVDFQEISEDQEISTAVPLHFVGAELAPGVKLNHGIFNAIENQIAVHCLPKNLPEFIEADVSHLQIGGSIHLGEIAPPSGVRFDEIVRGNDPALAVISEAAAVEEEVKQEEAAPAESETATNADTTAT